MFGKSTKYLVVFLILAIIVFLQTGTIIVEKKLECDKSTKTCRMLIKRLRASKEIEIVKFSLDDVKNIPDVKITENKKNKIYSCGILLNNSKHVHIKKVNSKEECEPVIEDIMYKYSQIPNGGTDNVYVWQDENLVKEINDYPQEE